MLMLKLADLEKTKEEMQRNAVAIVTPEGTNWKLKRRMM